MKKLQEEMNYKTAFWATILLYGLDTLVLTPYILFKDLGREVGLLCSWGYSLIGIPFFYIWFVVFSVLLWFTLKYFFEYCDRYLLKSNYPKVAYVLTMSIIMIYTIINNLKYVFN